LKAPPPLWHHTAMAGNDRRDVELWLAEMNRRILAGRPIARRELAELEEAYLRVTDRWGPPGGWPPRARLSQSAPLRDRTPSGTPIH
jgi:hypothetical protein